MLVERMLIIGKKMYVNAFTFGVCPFTLPARAREPWTLPMTRKIKINYFNFFTGFIK